MTMKKLLLLSLCLSGALSISAREFPLCMYGINDPADLPLLKQAGFSCIQSYERNPEKLVPLAAAAEKYGLKTVFYPQELWNTPHAQKAASWPVLAWYLVDEPDVSRWSRARVQETYQKTKLAWPKHDTALVIGQGRTRVPFYDLPDVMMVDWYPVPHLALSSFGDNVAWTRQGMEKMGTADRPVWGVVQIFDWKEFKQHRPDNDRIGRFPTKGEIRFMVYDGIVNSATGLFFFHFYSYDKKLPVAYPEYWERVTAVTKELNQFRPVLENGEVVASDIAVQPPLALQVRRYKKKWYFILVNRSAQEQPVPGELLKKKYKPVFKEQKTTSMLPYSVWILKK